VFPAFEKAWEAENGRDLTIEGVFGPSGTLAGQINLGAPADVALFSSAQHVNWLKVGRRVQRNRQPDQFGCTPMIIVARPGNPSRIGDFADLGHQGLRLVHPDPRSSGAGDWALLAEYGSNLLVSADEEAAYAQLEAIWDNVSLLAPSARAALTLFELGAGDALVTYEHDAYLAQERGVALEIVTPRHTIIAQPVAILVDDNVTLAERPAAEAFVRYLGGEAGQQLLSRYHLRSADCRSDRLPLLAESFTVDDLGGWPAAYAEVVEGYWRTAIAPQLPLEAALEPLGSEE